MRLAANCQTWRCH